MREILKIKERKIGKKDDRERLERKKRKEKGMRENYEQKWERKIW